MTAKTSELLASELDKAGLPLLAAKARADLYHDFLSPLDFPDMHLDADLAHAGTPEADALRRRHHNGEFDASQEESDAWAGSPDGKAAISMMVESSLRGGKGR
ncbi:hypothetical protein NKG99_20620 [Mesorhizobium sp. M1409]|uniref:hypothetical protein n=1 Tax=Mesorhizobium sp. M1409 TaxID=2957100 RepID=UPI003334B0B2